MSRTSISSAATVIATVLIAAATSTSVVQAQATATHQIIWENDFWANTDRNYTNGLQYSRMVSRIGSGRESGRDLLPKWARWFLGGRLFCVDDDSDDRCYNIRNGFLFGQTFYTPADLSRVDRIRDDRPYAGWLYGGVVTELIDNRRKHSHRFELDVGVLGPESQADHVQIFIHEDLEFSSVIPMGWGNQLDLGLGVSLEYDYRRSLIVKNTAGGYRWFDLSANLGATAGNFFSSVRVGTTARLGWNLSDMFPDIIAPVGFLGFNRSDVEVYVFAGATAHGVLLNETIEGSSLHAIEIENFVNDVLWGAVVGIGGFRVQYVIVTRSADYSPGAAQQRYGNVAVSWNKALP